MTDTNTTAAAGSVTSLSVCNSATGIVINSGLPTGQKGGILSGTVTSGASGGIVSFRYAQSVASIPAPLIILAGSSMTAFRIRGADYAEVYYTNDHTIENGDVVAINGDGVSQVSKTTKAYDGKMLGIISTKPGMVIGEADGSGKPVIVGLAGRVPVKVSTENGDIMPGDYLTSSSIPGVAMKATRSGQVIGQALTGYSGTEIGSVVVFIKNTHYDIGDRYGLDEAFENASTTITTLFDGSIADKFTHLVKRAFEKLTNVFLDIVLWVKELRTDRVQTNELCIEDVCVTKQDLVQLLQNPTTPPDTDNDMDDSDVSEEGKEEDPIVPADDQPEPQPDSSDEENNLDTDTETVEEAPASTDEPSETGDSEQPSETETPPDNSADTDIVAQ
jgi:hypothetical protein